MNFERIKGILTELGIPYAYYQFKEPPTGEKYIAYLETGKERFLADNKVYKYKSSFAIELYTKYKDIETEEKLISLFEQNEIVWTGGESTYMEDEKMYITVFYV